MPLSWNEIRNRAHEFSKRWEGESSERAEAQSFWNDFFSVFGIERKRVAVFEKQVEITRAGHTLKHGRIDAFWKGVLLIEHKSLGQDLSRAFAQAADYFEGLPERDLPRYILVSDFARFRLYDLEENTETEFKLSDLHKHIKHFAFIAGYRTQAIAPQNPVNIKAAERMGKLHDTLKAAGYEGHALEVLLVRLLFCLFAEDTGIFQPASAFRTWIEERTAPDGSDLGAQLALLFQTLNRPVELRTKTLDEQIAGFPYVNGKLFEEVLPIASFDAAMRDALLDCCALDWSAISPAIFGALFQSIMYAEARRNLGAHYTSEENILKLIQPLFLDDLHVEFRRIKGNKNKLFEFHKKLRMLTFFDPACGCGNFLIIAYRELRKLELEVLRAAHEGPGSRLLDIHHELSVDVDQFYGIELEEFPAQIAQVALWLMDHQMNVRVSEEFGMYFARIPLRTSPHIIHGNALGLDWNHLLPALRASYVFGNPPFVGAMLMHDSQREDMARVFYDVKGYGILDYVAAWYLKAARYMVSATPAPAGIESIKTAFVSTNSITQGEQVGILWRELLNKYHIKIHFAHRTFKWSNEASGVAAVHCVIIGFAPFDVKDKRIWDYETPDSVAHELKARNINPYLVDAPDLLLSNRSDPICSVPAMRFGSMPRDGGNLIFTDAESKEFIQKEPAAKKWLRPYTGAQEFLNGNMRWCLWLVDAPPSELRNLPQTLARIDAVRKYRLASKAGTTRKFAETPTLFCQIAQPQSDYLLVPRVSSERRKYIPIGFVTQSVIANDQVLTITGATLFHFGVLCSEMHNAWMRYTCGRLESRFRYSKDIVYNNFPWPSEPTGKQRTAVEIAAQAVLDARAQFPQSSFADLYDPLTMPPALVKAHQVLDRAVDACYRRAAFNNDAQRVELLFEQYRELTSILPPTNLKTSRKQRSP
jgi:MmeI, DNA-methyltransferase domain/MmeI, target recognition domain/MmeI, N-terminal domain/MmeI, C-terminal domain/MmeI, helicase spacer domain